MSPYRPERPELWTHTRIKTSSGPDPRVRLHSLDGGLDEAIDLGAPKGNRGDQQYAIPGGVTVHGKTVLIWHCAFSAPFGSARL